MAQIQLANFADSTLASSLAPGGTSITFAAANPTTTFPTVTGADWFYAVLLDTSANREIVKVTAHTAGTRIMTIVREQEGTLTSGVTFGIGSVISLRLTVQSFADVVAALGVSTSGIQSQSYTRVTTGVFGGAADVMTGAVTPTLVTYPTGLRITGTPNLANATTNPTLNVGTPGAKTIKKRAYSGVKGALDPGDYNASGPFDFEYDGTDFILLNPVTAVTAVKNRLVNGAMLIDQEYVGASTAISTGQYVCDQWRSYKATAGATVTAQQVSASLAGFEKALASVVTVGSAPAAGDFNLIIQGVEGLNVSDLQWGTANAKTVTLSFWAKQPVSGLYGGSLRNSANSRSYVFTYTIATANTWQYFTVTIPGDTSGTWLKDTGVGIYLSFDQGSGSSSETAAGAWAAGSYTRTSGCLKPITAAGTTVLTGVQLEVGSIATPFEYRPYGLKLALCQRYYELQPATVLLGFPCPNSGGYAHVFYTAWKATKRAAPTVSWTIGSQSNVQSASTLSQTVDGFSLQVVGTTSTNTTFTISSVIANSRI